MDEDETVHPYADRYSFGWTFELSDDERSEAAPWMMLWMVTFQICVFLVLALLVVRFTPVGNVDLLILGLAATLCAARWARTFAAREVERIAQHPQTPWSPTIAQCGVVAIWSAYLLWN
jgi:hypothetical protein